MNASPKTVLLILVLSAVVCGSTAGCTSDQLYGGVQAWQRTECQRIHEFQDRKRCMDSAAVSYQEYRKQTISPNGEK
jgi:hypothetical protein